MREKQTERQREREKREKSEKKKEEIRSFMYRERVNYIQTKWQIMRER